MHRKPALMGLVGTVAILMAFLVVILAVLAAGPAHARVNVDSENFHWHWSGKSETVIVETSGHTRSGWGLAKVVRAWDAAPHIAVRQGSCDDNPQHYCVTVMDYDAGASDWWGRAWTATADNDHAWVDLNTHYGARAEATCHELGHTLGIMHHDRPHGCLSRTDTLRQTPTRWELRTAGERLHRLYLAAHDG